MQQWFDYSKVYAPMVLRLTPFQVTVWWGVCCCQKNPCATSTHQPAAPVRNCTPCCGKGVLQFSRIYQISDWMVILWCSKKKKSTTKEIVLYMTEELKLGYKMHLKTPQVHCLAITVVHLEYNSGKCVNIKEYLRLVYTLLPKILMSYDDGPWEISTK